MANVLCVMAHPDDEVLGCGGALAKHAEAGDSVQVLVLSYRDELLDRFHEAVRALGCAGASELPGGGMAASFAIMNTTGGGPRLEDQRFDTRPLSEIADTVRNWYSTADNNVIYTHHPADLNLDHALTSRAVLTAFRPKPGEKPRTILACEVLSSTEYTYPPAFQPNWYVSLTGEQLEKKVQALECYETEIQPWPHPRSKLGVRNLAAYRGQSIGVEAAEAFQLLRRT